MRWAGLLWCSLLLAFTFAGAATPLLAADVESRRQTYPDDRSHSDKGMTEEDVAEFCDSQRRICRKICYLRFRDDLIGCPQACESRESRCTRTGCYRWTEPELLIAERFGGYECPR
jgi:hypothetical protein